MGTFLLKFDPMAACFNMMSSMLMDQRSVMTQLWRIFLLFVFAGIGVAFIIWASKRVALKGEK